MGLASFDGVEALTERQPCPVCNRNRMYFCYDCHVYVPGVAAISPRVKLPVAVDVIKHPHELNAKSTAVHCLLLAPDNTRIFDGRKDLPDYSDSEQYPNTVLVYPEPGAQSIQDYVTKHGPVKRFVVLDATWYTVRGMRKRPELATLPCVVLKTYKTEFWRPQKGISDEHLATIEAILFAIRENATAAGQLLDENVDNLLFWFYFFRSKVPSFVFRQKKAVTIPIPADGS